MSEGLWGKRVLVYVDGSDSSMRAVEKSIEMAEQGADVVALHVYPPRLDREKVSQFEIEPEDLDARFAREVLARVVERFERNRLSVETRSIEGPVADVICRESEQGDFHLVLVGRNPGGERRLRSLAEMVRSRSRVPVEEVG